MILRNRVAIVTGAGQGVGQGIANVLAREGAKVVIADLNEEKAKAAADLIKSKGDEAMACAVDVMNMAKVNAVVEATLKSFEGLHILVNVAVAPMIFPLRCRAGKDILTAQGCQIFFRKGGCYVREEKICSPFCAPFHS